MPPEPSAETPPRPAAPPAAISWTGDRAADAACWLHLVCPECGAMAEAEPQADCGQCAARIDPAR